MSFSATVTGKLEETPDLVTNPDGSVLVRARMKIRVEDQSPDHDIEDPTILIDIIGFGETARSLANLSEADTVSLALTAGLVKYRDGPEPRTRYRVAKLLEVVSPPLGNPLKRGIWESTIA